MKISFEGSSPRERLCTSTTSFCCMNFLCGSHADGNPFFFPLTLRASFSTPLFPPPSLSYRCRRAAFVDREEYEHSKIILCPLPSCGFRWCKECSKEVERGFQHSCDGSMEFNMLIEQKGWKRCPGCKAPVQKSEGCNHMTVSIVFVAI